MLVFVVAAVLPAAGPVGPAGAAAGNSCLDPRTPDPVAPPSGARPVVLVHGWTGTPLTDLGATLKQRLGSRIAVYPFDYAQYSSYWANNGHIAACLAEYVHAVSAVAGKQRVIVVAHSMGGIAIRYAFMQQFTSVPLTALDVGQIITLDTPYTGSPFGGTNWSKLKEGWQSFSSGVVDVYQKALPNVFTGAGDGGHCLGVHTGTQPLPSGCDVVPDWLPHGVDLTQIGGDITVDRKLFRFTMYSMPLGGDGIVDLPSEQGYAVSGPTAHAPVRQINLASGIDTCRITTSMLSAFEPPLTAAARIVVQTALDDATMDDVDTGRISPAGALVYGLSTLAGSCSHTNIVKDPPAVSQLVADITAADTRLDAGYRGPAALSLTGFGGAFAWGATRTQAEVALGQRFLTQDVGVNCQQATLPGVPGVVFGIEGGKVNVAAVDGGPNVPSPRPVTDTGLHVGDPVSKALTAYPKLVAGVDPSDAYTTQLVYVSGGREVQLGSMNSGDLLAPAPPATLAGQTVDYMQFGLSGSVGEAPCV